MYDGNNSEASDQQRPRRRLLALNEIDLIEVVRDIWGGKSVAFCLAILAAIFAIISVSLAHPQYTATALVGPAEDSGSRAGGLGQYAAAASALGVNLNANDTSQFTKFKEILDSNVLAQHLFLRPDVKLMLFGPAFDPKTGTYHRPDGLLFNIKDYCKGLIGLQRWTQPGPFAIQQALKSRLSANPDKATGFIKLSLTGDTPAEAEALLRTVSTDADGLLRKAARERAVARITYLNDALSRVTVQDQREAIINVLSTQHKQMMMASADRTFAIELIDPPTAEPTPTSPKPRETLVMFVLVAIVITAILAVVYGQRRRRNLAENYEDPETLDSAAVEVTRIVRARLGRRSKGRRGNEPGPVGQA